MGKLLLAKVKESILSVLPISILVIVLHLFYPLETWTMIGFLIGAVMLIIGMSFFTLGADMSMMSVGVGVGQYITKNKKVWLLLFIPFIIGIMITVAEPDLIVLANQVNISNFLLIIMVAIGVGLFLTIAMLRVVLKIELRYILIGCYILVFILAAFVPSTFVPIAFDSGGVTTGPMTVPFIMALGLGVASMNGGNKSKDDSFGYVALCSVGPILAVMILGLFIDVTVDTTTHATIIQNFSDFHSYFWGTFVKVMGEIALALLPILVFVIVFEFFLVKGQKKSIIKIFIGLAYTYVGLVLFLAGAHIGFMPVGSKFGDLFGRMDSSWILIPLGMIMGFFVVMAEPAVHVLNHQVEEVTSGAISKRTMLFSLAIGVSISIGLAMARVVFDFHIWWVIIPGYLIAIVLSLVVPKIFTAIAFDSGGVASGPMTATFLLPMATGACYAIYSSGNVSKILTNGFGVVALVAMTPLIVIQILGLIYQVKLHISYRRMEFPYEDIIEFDINRNLEENYE